MIAESLSVAATGRMRKRAPREEENCGGGQEQTLRKRQKTDGKCWKARSCVSGGRRQEEW